MAAAKDKIKKKGKRNRLENKRSGFTWILFLIVFLIFVLYAVSLIYPMLWGLLTSLKAPLEYQINTGKLLPEKWLFGNYIEAWKNLQYEGTSFIEMLWNSIWFSVGSILINMFFLSLASYVMSRYRFRGRTLIYNTIVFSMVIPLYGSFASVYRLYYQLRWVNSYLILLSATGVAGMPLIILSAYFKNLSWSFAESAQIDGAGHFKVFWSIMLPMAMPILASMFLLSFIGKWNDYMTALLYLPGKLTLAAGLFKYKEIAMRYGDVPRLYAGLFICMIPILILFSLLSKTMMKNMTFGGLKG